MLKLYENIRELRKKNKWTQDELAQRMGYTDRSTIAKIESGKVDLSQSKIVEFAKVFGVDPGELMGWETEDGVLDYVDHSYLVSPENSEEVNKAIELYEQYSKASPEVRSAVELLLSQFR